MPIKTTALEEIEELDRLDYLDDLISEITSGIIDDLDNQEKTNIRIDTSFDTWLMSGSSLSDRSGLSGPLEAETINSISAEKYQAGRVAWLAARKARAYLALSVVHPERFMDEEAGYEKEAIRQYVSEMVEDLSNTTICYVLKKLLK
jgi:hypothetical protein